MLIASTTSGELPVPARRPIVPNGVLGMIVFVCTSAMLFAGLISAYSVVRATSPVGWPPLDQPRLPVESTAFNTAALVASGVLLAIAAARFPRSSAAARGPMLASIVLGAVFVVLQGAEWVALLAQGLTLTSSTLGSFFYLIIGAHALHAMAGIAAMAVTVPKRIRRGKTGGQAVALYWLFVVALWPILYFLVYLS